MKIENITEVWYDLIIQLNNENTPAVSKLDTTQLIFLIEHSKYAWMILNQQENDLIGFCLILGEGINYQSMNYQWVSKYRNEFDYLDRVVIAKKFQKMGIGKKLYETWQNKTTSTHLLLEVNIRPKNEASLLFHEKLGFKAVGEQETDKGEKRVRYLELKK